MMSEQKIYKMVFVVLEIHQEKLYMTLIKRLMLRYHNAPQHLNKDTYNNYTYFKEENYEY